MKNIFKKIVIVSLVTSAVFAILAVLTGFDSEIGANILLTTMLLFPFSMAGLCCSAISEKKNLKWLSNTGMTICVISFLYYAGLIWGIFDICLLFCEEETELEWKLFSTLAVLPTYFAQISLLLSNNCETDKSKIIQKVTAILSTIICFLVLEAIWIQLIEYNELLGRLIICILILIAVGTILTRILSKPSKKIDVVKDIIHHNIMDDINNEEKTCPNCNKVINPEWKFCPNCNTQLIEEPKTCPNCNTKVEKEWKFCPNCNTSLEENKEKQSK